MTQDDIGSQSVKAPSTTTQPDTLRALWLNGSRHEFRSPKVLLSAATARGTDVDHPTSDSWRRVLAMLELANKLTHSCHLS